jgi:ribosomal protein L11 methyltransferase
MTSASKVSIYRRKFQRKHKLACSLQACHHHERHFVNQSYDYTTIVSKYSILSIDGMNLSRLLCRSQTLYMHVCSRGCLFKHALLQRLQGHDLISSHQKDRSRSFVYYSTRQRTPSGVVRCHDSLSHEASNIQYTLYDIPGPLVDELCDVLLMQGALSTSVSEYREEGGVEQEIFKDREFTQTLQQNPEYWNRCCVQACFDIHPSSSLVIATDENHDDVSRRAVVESLTMLGMESHHVTTEMIRPQDWEKNIKDEYQVMKITDSLWIVPSWDDVAMRETHDDANTRIILEPGLAFGTGDHPTTRLCLSWIHDMHKNGIYTLQILDYGTGSGVLAIAALVMDVADTAVGTDIEPLSVKASKYNASLNNVDDRFHVYLVGNNHQDPGDTSQYGIIIANILQGPLVSLAPTLAGYRRPSGETLLALSGITRYQVDDVISAYTPWFCDFAATVDTASDWALVTARSL